MTPGEMAWEGKDQALGYWLDKKCPKELDLTACLDEARRKAHGHRDSHEYSVGVIRKWAKPIALFSTWKVSMETNIMADESAERAAKAVEHLDAVTKAFRANTKNDISSMKAASERVQTEVSQMADKYKNAMALLNSPDFANAVLQAERMAKALECISALSDTKVNVAVFSGGGAQ